MAGSSPSITITSANAAQNSIIVTPHTKTPGGAVRGPAHIMPVYYLLRPVSFLKKSKNSDSGSSTSMSSGLLKTLR